MDDRVSVATCDSYDAIGVYRGVKRALGLLDLEKPKGKTVLLKVNCLMAAKPDLHITTHPSIVSALCRYFFENGAKKVQIGESTGGMGGHGRTANALMECGMTGVAKECGAELLDFDRCKAILVDVGKVKTAIAEPALKADIVVSVPKLKTHALTKYTGAVKNMFGCLPGDSKANIHRIAGSEPRFSETLLDIHSAVAPQLAVMDAIWGMEGNGPAHGAPRKIGAILASKSAVALDITASGIIGFGSEDVNTNRMALERGHVSMHIETVGDPVPKIPHFRKPITAPPAVMGFANRFFYNMISRRQPDYNEKCTGCATCASSCPVSAIKMTGNRPIFDRNLCIYCYCCHELCPHSAITLKWAPKLPFF